MKDEIRIEVPEGMEIDKENSTFELIKFKPKEQSYSKIAKALFHNKTHYWIASSDSEILTGYTNYEEGLQFIGTTRAQMEKLIAINKLMNVSKYLNKGWEPDFKKEDTKYYPIITDDGSIHVGMATVTNTSMVYFKSPALAKQAVNILGEDTIRLIYSTDW